MSELPDTDDARRALPPSTDDERRAAGMRTRREVLGDAWVDRAVAGTTPFTADFQDFITRVAWGDIWQRPGLSRRDRSLMTLSITIALRHWDEFALHVRAAITNGVTEAEIAEVLQHCAVYAGVPAANHAFADLGAGRLDVPVAIPPG